MTAAWHRLLAMAGLVLVVAYPVRALLFAGMLPIGLRLVWPVLVAGACWRPRVALVALVAVSPLLPIVPSLVGWPPALSLAQAAMTALLVAALLRAAVRGRVSAPPATVLLLAGWVTASLVASLWPLQLARGGPWGLLADVHAFASRDLLVAVSQRHLFAPVVAWAVFLEGLALLWLVRSTLEEAGDAWRRRVLVAAAAGATLAAAIGVVQWWTHWNLLPFWREVDPHITRINATFTDVNAFGAYLASMAPVLVAAAALSAGAWWRVAWSSGFVLVMAAAVFTASRAAWVALIVGMGLYGALLLRYRLVALSSAAAGRVSRVAGAATAAVAAGFVVLSLVATVRDVRHAQQDSYVDTVLYTLNFRAPVDERLKGRATLWAAAAAMVRAEPVEGIGLGRYFKDVSLYAADAESLIRPQENAHNYFLQLAAETGLPGLALFLAVVGLSLRAGLRASRDPARPPEQRRLTLAAAAGTAAFLATCLTGHSLLLRDAQLTFWVLPACAWLASVRAPAGARTPWRAGAAALAVVAMAVTLPPRLGRQLERVDLSRVTGGLYGEERDARGERFQWTGPEASFHVPIDSRAFAVRVRRLAPFAQRLTVTLDGRAIDAVDLEPGVWHTLRYLTPRSASGATRFHRVDLQVSPTWWPPGDGRELGVVVGAFGAEF